MAVTVPTLTPIVVDERLIVALGHELVELQLTAVAVIEVAFSGVVVEVDERLMLVLLMLRLEVAVTFAASLMV